MLEEGSCGLLLVHSILFDDILNFCLRIPEVFDRWICSSIMWNSISSDEIFLASAVKILYCSRLSMLASEYVPHRMNLLGPELVCT